MVLTFIYQRMKIFVLMIAGIWRRALCCFRRKRRNSCEGIPLTSVDVVSSTSNIAASALPKEPELQNWNSWEDNNELSSVSNTPMKPNSIQEHIEFYRQQQTAALLAANTAEKAEDNENFFEDMTPKITGQPKVLIYKPDESGNTATNKFCLTPQPNYASVNGQLGEWEESSGWEEDTVDDLDSEQMLREKRKQERERRLKEQQQRRQQRMMRPLPLGSKIST